MLNATAILGKVEAKRLQKAVDALVSGAYEVQITAQHDRAVAGFVYGGEAAYNTSIADDRCYCECPDSRFRHTVCKHVTLLALHVMRNPPFKAEKKPVNLHQVTARPGFAFAA